MSDNLPYYRNRQNDAVGQMTHEQAAVFPELLEFIEDYVDPAFLIEEPLPEEEAAPVADVELESEPDLSDSPVEDYLLDEYPEEETL